jgi:N-glycosylase/DNA lyase
MGGPDGFLLSQNNNIKRIRSMYERLSKELGSHVEGSWYAFPRPQELLGISERDLRSLGMGFRAPYLLDAIQNHEVLSGIPA